MNTQQKSTANQPSIRGLAKNPRAVFGHKQAMTMFCGCVGCLFSIWQAWCATTPWPDHQRPGPDVPALAEMAGGDLRPWMTDQGLPHILRVASLKPGELRQPVDRSRVFQVIDHQARHPGDPYTWPMLAAASLRDKSRAVMRPTPTYCLADLVPPGHTWRGSALTAPPGRLAARFESGPAGISCVGYTPGAGTSYGLFQIASGKPTFDNFLRFLENRAPGWYKRLSLNGPADTGGTDGAVPREWRRIALEDPKRFEQLQYEFILNTHYLPAVREIQEETGLDVATLSQATREVLWSVVVQHGLGGGSEIFVEAIEAVKPMVVEKPDRRLLEHALIDEVYKYRGKIVDSHHLLRRLGLAGRYQREKSQALYLLDNTYAGS